jgi:hypothetical protein
MKWVALIIVLASMHPFMQWIRRNPREIPKVFAFMGFLPFAIGTFHWYMAAISWAGWPGYVLGAEVSLLDALALALYFVLPRARHPLPFRTSMALYFVAVVLSAFQSPEPVASAFYSWQLARMFLVYAVVTKACADERVPIALLNGMGAGLLLEAVDALWERFGLGILQASGTVGHQNLLGLLTHFVVFPWFAILLAGRAGWMPVLVPGAGALVAVMTASRATLGLAGFGYFAIFVLSAMRRWTSRKSRILIVAVSIVSALTPLAMTSLENRFAKAPLAEGYDERAAFERAAGMMLSDHPMGVGANYYVVAANVGGYNSRAGVAWTSGAAFVHNVYWLVAAESGYFGVLCFTLMLLQPLTVAFLCGWRNRNDSRGDLMLGLGVALLVIYIHSFFEWVFVTFPAQYLFAIDVGMVAGVAQRVGYWPRGIRNPANTSSRTLMPAARFVRTEGLSKDWPAISSSS